MSRLGKYFLLVALVTGLPPVTLANSGFETFAHLPPGEQYRQFSLLLLISSRAGPELIHAMAPGLPADQADSAGGSQGSGRAGEIVNPDDFTTPLVRIVNQETLLKGAARLFRFTLQNREQITGRMEEIQADNAVLISMVDANEIMEDAIIIRHAIADSLSYAPAGELDHTATLVQDYRQHSIFLRNEMEYGDFYSELMRITDSAIDSVGGKMDAYQRMFDDEVEDEAFDRHIEAAEYGYKRRGTFDRRAAELTEQIMEDIAVSQTGARP